jgi:cytochrome d ubiquinol oxidase subunit I
VAGFVVAGVYATGMLKGRTDRYHRLAFLLAFTTAAVVMPVQIYVGDVAAREVFHKEPAKFAAMEELPDTSTHVPETVGGALVDGHVRYGVQVPDAASVLAGFSPDTTIRGLDAIPDRVRPTPREVTTTHLAYDAMVATGFALLGLAAWFTVSWVRRRDLPRSRWFLRCAAGAGVAAILCLECGWVVTEVGRQPWTVVGFLLTPDAVTTSGNVWPFFVGTLAIYVGVGCGAVRVLRAMRRRWEASSDAGVDVPYGPSRNRPSARSRDQGALR